ncbi:MAG: ImmA/IrrE family metallo-endopeptidase [Erysipelotrichaceae bacterium]
MESKEYLEAFQIASDLLKEINSYSLITPINSIINEYNIQLIAYSDLAGDISNNEALKKVTGFLCFYNEQYYIVYDDRGNIGRIRWTLAHELGHFFLGHDSKSNTQDYDKQETSANYFAAQLLMPMESMSMLYHYYSLTDELVSSKFNVSLEAAKYRLDFFIKNAHLHVDILDRNAMDACQPIVLRSLSDKNNLSYMKFAPLIKS